MPTVSSTALQDEVLTGEAVALDLQPLGFVSRATGALIDLVVLILAYIGVWLLLSWIAGRGGLDEQTLRIGQIAALVFVVVIIPTAIETASRGKSLGKLIMGGRIVRADGGTIGFRHAFIRALAGTIEVFATFGSIALLVGLFTPKAQRLGDLIAGTYSQRTRTRALPVADLQLPAELGGWQHIADVARMPDRLAGRLWQFAHQHQRMSVSAQTRLATELMAEAEPYVHPLPPTHPIAAVVGVVVVRRDREYRALTSRNQRAANLLVSQR